MSLFIALLTAILTLFFLNLFFQLAKAEKGMQNTVSLLEKFMVMRYNLKKEGEGESQSEANPDSKASAP